MELFFCKVLYEVLTETLLLLPGTPGGGKAWGQDEISLRTHTKIPFPSENSILLGFHAMLHIGREEAEGGLAMA